MAVSNELGATTNSVNKLKEKLMELEGTTTIERPPAEVFAAWSEVERYPEWFDMTIERRKVTDGPIGIDTRFHAVDKLPPGRRMEGTLEITAYQPNDLIAARLSEPFNATWEVRFEETESGTRMTFQTVANLSGLQRLVAPLMKGWAGRQLQNGIDRFKTSVESRAN